MNPHDIDLTSLVEEVCSRRIEGWDELHNMERFEVREHVTPILFTALKVLSEMEG